ncbi:serine hydrolase [Flectobacillus major]|uniref:serine hydrolase n=1 Tax=Flectobacillus major TaxID=103 RepID=UPI000414306D|nr:serine hydrolase [Flectobacillus major]
MKKTFAISILFILFQANIWAQLTPNSTKIDKVLETKLQNLVKGFHGDVGIYVRHLKKNKMASIQPDSIFPTASMIKVPITIGLFNKIEQGLLDYHAVLTFRDSLLYAGDDILGSFKDGEKIALAKVAMLMITTSDNTASLWCQAMATGTGINEWLDSNGFKDTRVNSRTQGREPARKKYGWGQTTPREMAELFVKIREGKVISPAASERIYRNLIRIYWDGEALSQIPPTVQVASKQGAVNQSRSEVLLVNAPSGDYVVAVITKNQKDESWERTNEGYVFLRAISKTVWEHFEPKSSWKPTEGMDKWY